MQEKRTYVNVVFTVPHSDIVEKSGFIQIHKGTWEQEEDTQDKWNEMRIYYKIIILMALKASAG